MTVWDLVYTVEVSISFTEDEMKSQEDLQGFFDFAAKSHCKEGWVRESVHDGNFVVIGTRVEERDEK